MKNRLSMECVFYFFKLFGTATIGFRVMQKDNHKITLTFTQSRTGIIYNAFLIFMILFLYSVISMHSISDIFYGERYLEGIICDAIDTYAVIIAIYILIVFCFRQKKAIKIAMKINKLILFSLPIKSTKQSIPRSIVVILMKNILIVILISIIFRDHLAFLMYLWVLNTCNFIINCVFMQYIMTLKIIKKLFEKINNNLQELTEINIYLFFKKSSISGNNLMSKIDELINLYESLAGISRNVSNFYSQAVLLCTTFVFMGLVFNLYFFVKSVLEKSMNVGELLGILYVFSIGSSFFLLAITAHNTTSEVLHFA